VADLSTKATKSAAHIQQTLSGDALKHSYNDPTTDSRTPDIVVLPELGVVYTTSLKKIAEHGGFSSRRYRTDTDLAGIKGTEAE
jgi:hypothetical protein